MMAQDERIDRFLAESGLAERDAKVLPLTGDASDRQYFRVLLRNEPSQVLALHTTEIDFDKLPFVNVSRLLSKMPVPVPRILAHSNSLGIIALQDLGDVTLQAHLGAATPADYLATCVTLAARERHPLTAGSVLWDDVMIEPGARLRGSVVTDGVRLPPGDWFDVTIRRAEGNLEPFEERRGNLAIAPLR